MSELLRTSLDADHAFHAEFVAASGSPRLRRVAAGLLVETRMCLAVPQLGRTAVLRRF